MPKTRPVATRVTYEEFDKLQLHADARGISLSTLILERIRPLLDEAPSGD